MLPTSTAKMSTTTKHSNIRDIEGFVATAAMHLEVKSSFLTRDQTIVFIPKASSFGLPRMLHKYFGSTLVRVS